MVGPEGGIDASAAFELLPKGLRGDLLDALNDVVQHYRAGRWESAALNGGKFSEAAYTVVLGHLSGGDYQERASKPKNMVEACRALEQFPKDAGPHSMRILIPRTLVALYDIRNNRSIGHTGGDVDPNHMDSTVVLSMCRWVLAELIRVLHDINVKEATDLVEALTTREVPTIWRVGDVNRVLDSSLTAKDQTLLLLYGHGDAVTANDLIMWTEYTNPSRFKASILMPLHRARLVEYRSGSVLISPKGVAEVETRLSHQLVG